MPLSSALHAWKSQPLVLVLLVCGATAIPLLAHSRFDTPLPKGATEATPGSEAGLIVAVTDGVEEKVLTEVRALHPELDLVVKRFADPTEARAALLAGTADVGAFETFPSLARLPDDVERSFVTGATTVTLPYCFYSRSLGQTVPLAEGARIAFAKEDEARALWLLHYAGLVSLRDDAPSNAEATDIVKNARKFELVFTDRSALEGELARASLVGLDYEQAHSLGLAPRRHAWLMEDGYSAFSHVLTGRAAARTELERLAAAYRTKPIQRFVLDQFQDSVRRSW